MHIRYVVDEPVKSRGGDVLYESGRAVFGADHADDLIALLPLFQYLRDTGGRMLQVRVHADHHLPAAKVHAGNHGRLMAEVPGEADKLHPLVLGRQSLEHKKACVGTAVIDKNQLPVPACLLQHPGCLSKKIFQRFLLVVDGNYNGNRPVHGFSCSFLRFARPPRPLYSQISICWLEWVGTRFSSGGSCI